jgi:hypothetical protein
VTTLGAARAVAIRKERMKVFILNSLLEWLKRIELIRWIRSVKFLKSDEQEMEEK